MTWLEVFFSRFDDKRHQLADAGLAYLAETNGIETVLTLDSDFSIYRIHDGRTRLNVIPPQSTG
jgi:predicted nucleic acid-binding protein